MKDCACITHAGPHWLYMDLLDRERNLKLLERLVHAVETRNADDLSLDAYLQAEEMRRQEKRLCMEQEDRRRGEPGTYPYTLLGVEAERIERIEQKHSELLHRLDRALLVPAQGEVMA